MLAVDLHIHSCLSPCADADMTPYNIVGMAMLKGLNAIAVCDHNSAQNLPAIMRAGAEYGVCVVPGIEVTSREDVHLLCYFETLEGALQMGEHISSHQPKIKNKPHLFGEQHLYDEEDNLLGTVEHLLLVATDFSAKQVAELARSCGGVMVPAHVNKGANSMLMVLGDLPSKTEAPTIEVFKKIPLDAEDRLCLFSSDAHYLEDILEQGHMLDCESATPKCILETLRRGKP